MKTPIASEIDAVQTAIRYRSRSLTVLDIKTLYENERLELSPGFQRASVWRDLDRKSLIDSIIRGYPIPAVFFYQRLVNGSPVYDVIDGKQRIETLLRFTGVQRPGFSVKVNIRDEAKVEIIDWKYLRNNHLQYLIDNYEMTVIELDGNIGDVISLFVRINSTGKALSRQEKIHAKFYSSGFLKAASRIAEKFKLYFLSNKILTDGQIARMKHVEFICELMLSLNSGEVINKKAAIDRAMMQSAIDGRSIARSERLVKRTLQTAAKMFPELRTSRFCKLSDFYTLAVLIGKYDQRGMVLSDRKKNRLAWDLLRNFGRNVDELSEKRRRAAALGEADAPFREYLLTVLQGTDEVNQRKKRETQIDELIGSIFEKKDDQRLFSPIQRRIIWNSANERVCAHPGCKEILTWSNFTVDHIEPHSKGGRTCLDNAALMCREHNSAKGNRRAPRARIIGASRRQVRLR